MDHPGGVRAGHRLEPRISPQGCQPLGGTGGVRQLEQATANAAGVSLATTRGTAELAIEDGTLPGLDLVRPVIIAFGTSGRVAAGGNAFSRLSATLALADGVLVSDDLALDSDDVDLRGQGTVRLSDLRVDLTADLVVSGALSATASARPLSRRARRPREAQGALRSWPEQTRRHPLVNVALALFDRDAGEERRARALLGSVASALPATPLQQALTAPLASWPVTLDAMTAAPRRDAAVEGEK